MKPTKIEGLSMRFEGQDCQEKRHTNLMCDSHHKSHKDTPPTNPYEIPRKGSENPQKEKPWDSQANHKGTKG
jgi:hypothetical protein